MHIQIFNLSGWDKSLLSPNAAITEHTHPTDKSPLELLPFTEPQSLPQNKSALQKHKQRLHQKLGVFTKSKIYFAHKFMPKLFFST